MTFESSLRISNELRPEEIFKACLLEAINNALYDFGLRRNKLEYVAHRRKFALISSTKAIVLESPYNYPLKTDFSGTKRYLFLGSSAKIRLSNDLDDREADFLISNDIIEGLDDPEKLHFLAKMILNACEEQIVCEKGNRYDLASEILTLESKTDYSLDARYIQKEVGLNRYTHHYTIFQTNAHEINSLPNDALDIVKGHLQEAILKYFSVEPGQKLDQFKGFTTALNKDEAKDRWKEETSALKSAKSHQFYRLVTYGLSASEDFRIAACEIGEWQIKRIAELPSSIRATTKITAAMEGYKNLSVSEKAEAANFMIREIAKLQKCIRNDVLVITRDCEITDEAQEIMDNHRNNIFRYVQGLELENQRLAEFFGLAEVQARQTELKQIFMHTGIQVAQQAVIHQSYNTILLKQITSLSNKMDMLSASVHRLKVTLKLSQMLGHTGVVADIAREILGRIGLNKEKLHNFNHMGPEDLHEIIDQDALFILDQLKMISKNSFEIERSMISGKPASQVSLPHYNDIEI